MSTNYKILDMQRNLSSREACIESHLKSINKKPDDLKELLHQKEVFKLNFGPHNAYNKADWESDWDFIMRAKHQDMLQGNILRRCYEVMDSELEETLKQEAAAALAIQESIRATAARRVIQTAARKEKKILATAAKKENELAYGLVALHKQALAYKGHGGGWTFKFWTLACN
jgi:hypothetical protein